MEKSSENSEEISAREAKYLSPEYQNYLYEATRECGSMRLQILYNPPYISKNCLWEGSLLLGGKTQRRLMDDMETMTKNSYTNYYLLNSIVYERDAIRPR